MSDLFKNVIIFGANGDIGSAFARALLSNSVQITLVARDRAKIDPTLMADSKTEFLQYSFPSDTLSLKSYLSSSSESFDLCVNAIGIYAETENILDNKHFQQVLDSNFGVLQEIIKGISPFIDSKAKFINISSIASHSGNTDEVAYSSSKILVDKLMSSLRFIDSFRSVQTLNVRPGAVKSRMTSRRAESDSFIDPDELAELCLTIICSGSSLTVPTIDVYRGN